MTTNNLLFQLALKLVPNIGDVHANTLIQHFGNAEAIFQATKKDLERIEGIGTIRANAIKRFNDFSACEKEMAFLEKYQITPLFADDPKYPQRLLNCFDHPLMLYYKGTANLNPSKMIAIVGTRNNSPYGRMICEQLIADLQHESITIVSGLASGIDTIAHRSALKNNLPTIGVLAHGLDQIYPSQNKSLAKEMIQQGGLLTEFMSDTKPDKQNFPKRNRIAAGMCDAILVIETGIKGGSLITAELANGYHKDVFAFPGKTTDPKSEGCNLLIKNNKASLITSAADLMEMMNWHTPTINKKKLQRELFIELSGNEKIIFDLLQTQSSTHIDDVYLKSKLNTSAVAAALLSLEMKNIICCLPGKIYKLL